MARTIENGIAGGTLPIAPYLDDILAQLYSSPTHFLVLTAQTAAGKSTGVPLGLLRLLRPDEPPSSERTSHPVAARRATLVRAYHSV